MPTSRTKPLSIALIWTRRLDGEAMAGRLRMAHAIRTALTGWADVTSVRLPTLLTDRSALRLVESVLAWLISVWRGPLLPIQCALFASPSDHRRLFAQIPPDVTSVYLDGVRSYAFLVYLRKKRPDMYVVVDMDDLMSRRMTLLLHSRQPLSPGYLTKHLPSLLKSLVMSKTLGNIIVRYEGATLVAIEREMGRLADVVVLPAAEEATILRARYGPDSRTTIEVIPPSLDAVRPPARLNTPVRFVFIGSDALTQNRLTIDYLVDLWRRAAIQAPLVLFGLQSRTLSLPPSVSVAGYVDKLTDVYDGRSVLVTPALIGGGVKTKVLEAFAYGAPVIGNPSTFESMPIVDYPLTVSDEASLIDMLNHAERYLDRFEQAAIAGAAYLGAFHGTAAFTKHLRQVMSPPPRDPAAPGVKTGD